MRFFAYCLMMIAGGTLNSPFLFLAGMILWLEEL